MRSILLVLFASIWNCFSADVFFKIQRQKQDVFVIPSELCQANDTSKQCISMGGNQLMENNQPVDCTCQCNLDEYSSVFGFLYKKWKCETNHDVRSYGNNLVETLEGKTMDASPAVAVPSYISNTYLGRIPITGKRCRLDNQFAYLDCNSDWKLMQNSNHGFYTRVTGWSNKYLEIYVYSRYYFNWYNPKLYGYVLKLNIQCSHSTFCVILKIKGTIYCPVPLPTTPTTTLTANTTAVPTRSYIPSTVSTSTRLKHSSTTAISTTVKVKTTSISTTELSSTSASITNTRIRSTLTLTIIGTTSDASSTVSTSKSTLKEESKQFIKKMSKYSTKNPLKGDDLDTADNSGSITGSICGAIAVVAILIILILLAVRRKRNKKSSSERLAFTSEFNDGIGGSTKLPRNHESPIYNTLEDPDYAKLVPSQYLQNMQPQVLKPSGNESKAEQGVVYEVPKQVPIYDVLEDPNFALKTSEDSEGPIYNTLEDPNYAKLEKSNKVQNGPSWNVPERREPQWSVKQKPSYDVIEGQNSTRNTPVYDILEGPKSDEQHVYGSLNFQDPHIYGALNSPEYEPSDVYSGYDDADYQSVGDVIQAENIYQALNKAGQWSCDDVYQPLRDSMTMKNISGVTQSYSLRT